MSIELETERLSDFTEGRLELSHDSKSFPYFAKALENKRMESSRLPGFAKSTVKERLQILLQRHIITDDEARQLELGGLNSDMAEKFVENCIGTFALPFALATNFLIDDEDILVPMVIEESSVVAAASFGAKLARPAGGFTCVPSENIATAQVHFVSQLPPQVLSRAIEDKKASIQELLRALFPKLLIRGGGLKSAELRVLDAQGNYCLHLNVDTKEAMGANIVNSLAENVGNQLPSWFSCEVGLKILTNLVVHRVTKVSCEVRAEDLSMPGFSGTDAVKNIVSAYKSAERDVFRAATHNKGIMNGIDAVVMATGNDWRAVSAGCHAFASLEGSYQPLSHWSQCPETGNLLGTLSVPLAVGTVGGVTRLHPGAKTALEILRSPSSSKLSCIIASAGLAQNLSALRALACEGIQKGHMALHEKNLEMMRKYDHLPNLKTMEKPNRF